jgi:hypothetical protein
MESITLKCGKYQHYKNGKFYEVIGVARHSETQEEMVVYIALYLCPQYGLDQLWVRPKSMFTEIMTYEGKNVPRFQWVDANIRKI